MIVVGVATGVMSIVNGARLLVGKKNKHALWVDNGGP